MTDRLDELIVELPPSVECSEPGCYEGFVETRGDWVPCCFCQDIAYTKWRESHGPRRA